MLEQARVLAGAFTGMALSSDGLLLATCSKEKSFKVFDVINFGTNLRFPFFSDSSSHGWRSAVRGLAAHCGFHHEPNALLVDPLAGGTSYWAESLTFGVMTVLMRFVWR